jgi:hypothetical protein
LAIITPVYGFNFTNNSHFAGRSGREYLEPEITAEILCFVNGHADRGTADKPHNLGWRLWGVDLTFPAQGALIPRLQMTLDRAPGVTRMRSY